MKSISAGAQSRAEKAEKIRAEKAEKSQQPSEGANDNVYKHSVLEKMARKFILASMRLVSIGRLTLIENDKTYHFGEDEDRARVSATIVVKHPSAYKRVMLRGTIGSAEAYMEGGWTTPSLTNVVRLMVLNQNKLKNMDLKWSFFTKKIFSVAEVFRRNSLSGSKRNISAHYDLSNDFFELFLDKTMMYSAAIFPKPESDLEEAAFYKLDHICRRLNLKKGEHLIEIGTGWGGMAIHAAKYFGCHVTTTTISEEQYQLAKKKVEEERLSELVNVIKQDYRKLEGKFDKLVSIEMIEAVGHQYYPTFFEKCSELLKDSGLMLIQAITTPNQRFEEQKNRTDFIRKYIFPGGCLPSQQVIEKHIGASTDMQLVGLEDITLHYSQTLRLWRERFFENIESVRQLGFDDVFIRMWEFYLCYCEGGFQERVINTSQLTFAKPLCRELPDIRHYQPTVE